MYVEDLNDARMKPGERRVLARWGWAGEKADFFNVLLIGVGNTASADELQKLLPGLWLTAEGA